jgi:hypothetical protein
MTEMAQGMSQSPDNSSNTPASSSTASTPQSSIPSNDERTFRQSEVTDIVKRERNEAVDRYRRLQAEQPDYVAQKYGDAGRHQQPQTNMGVDENRYRQIAAEEAQRLRDQWTHEAQTRSQEELAQRTVQNFWNKVQVGREKYQDFDKVTGDIQYASFPNVVQLLADYVDNSGDVLYELGKDRTKMAVLENLAMMSPKDAIVQAQRLSSSLKENDNAKNVRVPNEPLSQLRPSNTGMDNGAWSVGAARKKYKG